MQLIGPFSQIISMRSLALAGPIKDDKLEIITQGGVLVDDQIIRAVGFFDELAKNHKGAVTEITQPTVLMPGFVDCHTHLCFAGSRAKDYALRVAGASYLEIAKSGGGILDTVKKTRAASEDELMASLTARCDRQLKSGVTTCEVKSGYGLSVVDEVKMLSAIQSVNNRHSLDLIPTCLAAHVKPLEFKTHAEYLDFVLRDLLPVVKQKNLATRVDVFVEDGAFGIELSRDYLLKSKKLGFDVVVHADQFSTGGAKLAAEVGAGSADHLEASSLGDIQALVKAGVVCVVLPGASLGLGMGYAPARLILDNGGILAIASDFNPGSAPMGDLLTEAAVLGAAQKLTIAETFSAMTFRAAHALKLNDRGRIDVGLRADFVSFATDDYREILYHQGQMRPV